jgi:hypothetical protein
MSKESLVTPKFTLQDVRYATDESIVARAEKLFSQGKVKITSHSPSVYRGIVKGSQLYQVWLSPRSIEEGDCECYMGQRGEFCKHLLAFGFAILDATGQLAVAPANLSEAEAKKQISAGARKFVGYSGPSSIWFSYQRKLDTGTGLIIEALPFLPPTKATITYLWKLIVRLSKKLAYGGIDDSNGTVGSCIHAITERIAEIAKSEERLLSYTKTLCVDDTGFGFEEELQALLS